MRFLFITEDWIIDPLGIGYIASAIRKAGHEVDIIKMRGVIQNALDKIDEWCPHFLCFSVTTGLHNKYADVARKLKWIYPEMVTIFGGPHCTFFPDFINTDGVDIVVTGEAEEIMERFGQIADKRDGVPPNIPGMRIKLPDGNIAGVPRGSLPQNLDALAWPARDLLYKYSENIRNPIRYFMGTRGCVYQCTHCYAPKYREIYGRVLRFRKPGEIIREIDYVMGKYPAPLVYFQDDLLIVNRKWFLDLMQRYYRHIRLPFHAHIRAELVDGFLVDVLKSAGCYSVTLASETGNEWYRRKVLRRKQMDEDLRRCAKLLRKAKIKFRVENMLGLPMETWDDAKKTLKFTISLKPTVGWASLFQPYPSTKLAEFIERYLPTLWNDHNNKFEEGFFTSTPLSVPHARRLNNLQKFFMAVVKYPFLYPFALILSRLPENKYFVWFYRWFKRRMYMRSLFKPDARTIKKFRGREGCGCRGYYP